MERGGRSLTSDSQEFWPLDKLSELQRSRWETQRAYLEQSSPFLRRLWEGRAAPEKLDEIACLPLCDKVMLRESQAATPPFGDYLAVAPAQVMRIHRTSGTTGRAMNIAQTEADAFQTALVGARAHRTAGLGPGHIVVHCLNYQMWMGGFTDHTMLEAAGATVIPFGVGGSELLIRTIQDLKVTAIHCTPSYPAVLEQTIAEHFPDITPRDLGLELGLFGGEAGLDNPSFRARLEETWGFAARNANYGVSDVFSNFASQCAENNDLHFVGLDVLYPELIEPENGEPLPWRAGATGELVLTHLAREAQPLVRFRTNDLITITETGACACGRTAPRFRVLGRSDDMVIVRGINVFPTAIGGVINRFEELSGEFRIVLRGPGPYDRLPVEAELAQSVQASPALAEAIASAIKDEARVSASVDLLAPLSLPRSEGKTQRVIREETS
ncbi:MAG: AMP-binding protein [Alphaproteobacteria bacterium]